MEDLRIEYLGLSNRSSNALKRYGINMLSEILKLNEMQISSIKNLGKKSVEEILELKKEISAMSEQEYSTYINKLSSKITTLSNSNASLCEKLVIEFVNPELELTEHTKVYYRTLDGIISEKIDITDLHFSSRTTNVLLRSQLTDISMVGKMRYSNLIQLSGLGQKSIDELFNYFKNNVVVKNMTQYDFERMNNICKSYIEQLNVINNVFYKESLQSTIASIVGENYEEICPNNILNVTKLNETLLCEKMLSQISGLVLDLLKKSNKAYSMSELESMLPNFVTEIGLLNNTINSLINSDAIENNNGFYREKKPTIMDWVESCSNSDAKLLLMRMNLKTLEECGLEFGVTRERVRQRERTIIEKKPELREDDYAYWYTNYDLGEEEFNYFFGREFLYGYMKLVYKKSGSKDVEGILEDENASEKLKRKVKKYLLKDTVDIDGTPVPIKRNEICIALAKSLFSERDGTFQSLYDSYLDFLDKNGLQAEKKLAFSTERAFEARLQDSMYILQKNGRRFRYYPINEIDIVELIDRINLYNYKDLEISTRKFLAENRDVLDEYDIQDEYELHNMLKKTQEKWNNREIKVSFNRMPHISIGNANREKQVLDLLYLVAPVTFEEYAEYYEMEYGTKAESVMADFHPIIKNYYHNGIYSINQPLLTNEEFDFLVGNLNQDFYITEDVKKIFIKQFGEENGNHINARTLKELGFNVYTGYIVRNTFPSAKEYFRHILLVQETFNLKNFDSRMLNIVLFHTVLEDLRTKYLILEYDVNLYVRTDHFSSVIADFNIDSINSFVDAAIDYAKECEYFTLDYLKQNGFYHELFSEHLPDWFYISLIKNSKKCGYVKAGTPINVIFNLNSDSTTCAAFFYYVLKEHKSMDIGDFRYTLIEEYGINMSIGKIKSLAKEPYAYYDSIMDRLYLSKDHYYMSI